MVLGTSSEEIKKMVEDYDPTVEEYNSSYEVMEEAVGKVTSIYEDRVVMVVTSQSGKMETRYFSPKIPFIFNLKIGQKIKITTYYNYDVYTEMYDILEEKDTEETVEKSKEIVKDLVCEC